MHFSFLSFFLLSLRSCTRGHPTMQTSLDLKDSQMLTEIERERERVRWEERE